MRKAHIRDGAAIVSYLAWLDAQMQDLYGAAGYFSEVKGGSLKRKRSCVLSLFLSLLYCDLSLNSEEKNLTCQALFGAQASSLTS
jgi:hypothetical protein